MASGKWKFSRVATHNRQVWTEEWIIFIKKMG